MCLTLFYYITCPSIEGTVSIGVYRVFSILYFTLLSVFAYTYGANVTVINVECL
jgi:hypothetical protein